ncbi:hypothetical protein DM02DRAFT_58146 [Periconia macrospinosa]|uniref:Uncharacterized protein n=1 Tax=Periconia macrospinosa TaxID=97972 RepID=A0A2V1DK32_9PLEO|nr:hypothetical protein DM02DRAFT_58146 [Periconia macrospinosa]
MAALPPTCDAQGGLGSCMGHPRRRVRDGGMEGPLPHSCFLSFLLVCSASLGVCSPAPLHAGPPMPVSSRGCARSTKTFRHELILAIVLRVSPFQVAPEYCTVLCSRFDNNLWNSPSPVPLRSTASSFFFSSLARRAALQQLRQSVPTSRAKKRPWTPHSTEALYLLFHHLYYLFLLVGCRVLLHPAPPKRLKRHPLQLCIHHQAGRGRVRCGARGAKERAVAVAGRLLRSLARCALALSALRNMVLADPACFLVCVCASKRLGSVEWGREGRSLTGCFFFPFP